MFTLVEEAEDTGVGECYAKACALDGWIQIAVLGMGDEWGDAD